MSLSIPEIIDEVEADFLLRGINVPVLFGEWETFRKRSDSRVIIGLGDFSFGSAGPTGAPGLRLVDSDHGARSIATRTQTGLVWVYAAPNPDPKTPNRTEAAHVAACALLHATEAALQRAAHGSAPFGAGGGKWPTADRVEGILYGALATFLFEIQIPVLDDVLPKANVDINGYSTSVYATINGVEELGSSTP